MGPEFDWLLATLQLFNDRDQVITSMGESIKTAFPRQDRTTILIGGGAYSAELAKQLKTSALQGHIPVYVQFLGPVQKTLSPDRVFKEMPGILRKDGVVAHTLFFVPPERRDAVLERFRTLPGEVSVPPQTHEQTLVTELLSQQVVCVVRVGRVGYQPSRG